MFLAILLTGLMGASSMSEASAPPAARSPETFTLFASTNRLLAMLRVGSAPPIPVVFDTGTNENILDLKYADTLHLAPSGPSDAVDGQGTRIPGHMVELRGARLGGVALSDGPAAAIAYDEVNEIGVFGPNSFPDRLVRVDLDGNRVQVLDRDGASRPRCAGYAYSNSFAFTGKADDTLPSVQVRIGEQSFTAEVDTGNDGGLLLPSAMIDKLPLEAAPKLVGYAVSAGSREPVLKGRLSTDVTVAGVVLSRPEVLFSAAHKPNVGLSILRRFTLIFDPSGQRDWLIPQGRDPVTCTSSAALGPR